MFLTGRQLLTQRVYPQTGFTLNMYSPEMKDMDLTFIGSGSYTGVYSFTEGKIYNHTGQIIGLYNSGDPFSFRLNFETGRVSSWIGDSLAESYKTFSSQNGLITGLSFSGKYSGSSEYNISLYGSLPGLYFSPLRTDDLINFTGFIRATGYQTQLYSISPEDSIGTVTTTAPFNSGNYSIVGISGRYTSGSQINTDFIFDFGKINYTVPIEYNLSISPSGFVNLSSEESVTGQFDIQRQYQDFNVNFAWSIPNEASIYLQFVERSGYTNIYASGLGTGLYSGYISGSGFITGNSISGYCQSGYFYQYTGTLPTGISPSLLVTGTGVTYAYATGELVAYYRIMVTGYEATSIGPGIDNTTGWISGYITGNVGPGSGRYHFYQQISGRPPGTGYGHWSGSYSQGNYSHSGYYNSPDNPTSVYLASDFGGYSEEQNYLGVIDFTGVLATNMYDYLGNGMFTGIASSQLIYSTSKSLITGFNLLTGEYNEMSGSYSYVSGLFVNFGEIYGYDIVNGIVSQLDNTIFSGVYPVGIRMTYDQNLPWGVTDKAKLYVATNNSLEIIDVYGYSVG